MPSDINFSKIRDSAIRALAEKGSSAIVDVLIELDVPQPFLTVSPSLVSPERNTFAFSAPDCPTSGSEFQKFYEFLKSVGVQKAHPLELANAYSASLPAKSLQELTSHPMVIGIDENVRRR